LGHIVRNIFVLTGYPGAGKGTQARLLSQLLKIPNISTGDLVRALAATQTDLGRQIARQMLSGGFVGDDIVNQAITQRIGNPDCDNGFVLDGYPRTASQARFLQGILHSHDRLVVLDIAVSPSEIIQRISSRRICASCGTIYNLVNAAPKRPNTCDLCVSELIQRGDDRIEVVQERLRIYNQQTRQLIEYYRNRGLYWRINGNTAVADVSDQISRTISEIVSSAVLK
jgi:adenylate kinase